MEHANKYNKKIIHIYVHTYINTQTNIHTHTHIHTHVHTYIHTYICIYIPTTVGHGTCQKIHNTQDETT